MSKRNPHRPRGGARPPMLTICWVAGYSTCVLPVNMPVASAVQSLQSCLRFGEVCAWRGLKLTEPANCDLRPHDFWRMAAKNLLRLDVKWQCITSSCGSGGTGRRARLRILWPKNRGGSSPLSRTNLWWWSFPLCKTSVFTLKLRRETITLHL